MATDTQERGPDVAASEDLGEEDNEAVEAFNALPDEVKEDLVSLADAEGLTVEAFASSQGKTIEQLAAERAENGDEPEELPPMQIPLPGTSPGISAAFGGAKPTESEIRLLGGKMPLEGSFQKGEEFDVIVRVKVTGVLGQDVTDDWGRTTRTTRRHMARMISVKRFGSG